MRCFFQSILFLLAATCSAALAAPDPFGDISELKLANADDKVDVPTVPPPKNATVLFDGKTLDNWVQRNGKDKANWKLLDGGILEVASPTADIITREAFDGSFKLHVEFRVGYQPQAKGQRRGNSGVYLQGRYEVQVLDSYGVTSKHDDCGGIYSVAAPLKNACKAPTIWQSFDIEFHAPRCKDGKRVEPALMTVHHNGVKIHDNVKITIDNSVRGLGGDVCKPGPILLQENGCPVQYRNIWLVRIEPPAPATTTAPPASPNPAPPSKPDPTPAKPKAQTPTASGALAWTTVTASPIPRVESPAAVIANKLYLFGGFTHGLVPSPRLDVYDPAGDTWARLKDLPTDATHLNPAVAGNTVWFAGGFKGRHPGKATDEVWKYDIAADAWEKGPPLPEPRGRRAGGGGERAALLRRLQGGPRHDDGQPLGAFARWRAGVEIRGGPA